MLNSFSGSGNTVAVSASTTSAFATLPGIPDGGIVRVYNSTFGVAFFRFTTDDSPTAVPTDTFIGPGSTETFSIPYSVNRVAVILSEGSGPVYFQRGRGQ